MVLYLRHYGKSSKVLGIFAINFYYIENINEYSYKCLDRIHYYELSSNEEKKYIYLSTNDKLNTYLDNIALKDTPQSNNFYALNKPENHLSFFHFGY